MPQHCHRVCAHVCTFLWDVHDEQREALTVATGVLMQRWVAVIMNWLTQIIILPKLQLSHFSVLNGNKLIYKSGIQLKPLYTLCDHFGKDGPFCVKKTKQKQNKCNVIHYVCCNYWWESALSFQNVIPYLFPKFQAVPAFTFIVTGSE